MDLKARNILKGLHFLREQPRHCGGVVMNKKGISLTDTGRVTHRDKYIYVLNINDIKNAVRDSTGCAVSLYI